MKKHNKFLSIVLLYSSIYLSLGLSIVIADDKPDSHEEPHLMDIVNQTVLKYANLKSFSTEGEYIRSIDYGEGMKTVKVPFKIKMARPDNMKITWAEDSDIVWSVDNEVYSYSLLSDEYEKWDSIEYVLGALRGVSHGITGDMPDLFFSHRDIFDGMKNFKLLDADIINGEECYVLVGGSEASYEATFWISKDRYLIVKSKEVEGKNRIIKTSTDEEAAAALTEMGIEVNDRNIKGLQKMNDSFNKSMNEEKWLNRKGTSEYVYKNININGPMDKSDFKYPIPTSVNIVDQKERNKRLVESFN